LASINRVLWRPQMAQHQGENPRKGFLVKSANLYIREKYSQFLTNCRPVHFVFTVPTVSVLIGARIQSLFQGMITLSRGLLQSYHRKDIVQSAWMLHPTAELQSLPPGRLEPKNTYSHFFMSVPSHADPAIFLAYPDPTFQFDKDLDPTIKR
jgi:hypothetical protein